MRAQVTYNFLPAKFKFKCTPNMPKPNAIPFHPHLALHFISFPCTSSPNSHSPKIALFNKYRCHKIKCKVGAQL